MTATLGGTDLPAGTPLPTGFSTLFAGAGAIKGENRLVTLFTLTGQITTNESVPFDSTGIARGAWRGR